MKGNSAQYGMCIRYRPCNVRKTVLHHRKKSAFDLTKASAKFEVATSNGLGGDAFTRKYIISLLTLTLGQGQTQNVAQYPLHHMIYAPAKFEAAMSNALGENAFTRSIYLTLTQGRGHMKHCPLHHMTYKV